MTPPTDPHRQQQFALEVVKTLRQAGHQALWAGGCVRDFLLGKTPKDYDIATDALPERVRAIFSPKRTLAIGAAFGVIQVRGPNQAGAVEVATFRQDGNYLDGRRPTGVRYCSPEEDAARRDFTINGMFFDPVEQKVHDFVGGNADLAAGLIRAIGDPDARFGEDKLRMLRAIRFATVFDFALDEATFDAIRRRAGELRQVSAERIREELRRMLEHPHRRRACELLAETGLLRLVVPELVAVASHPAEWRRFLVRLSHLEGPNFATALAPAALALCRPLDPVALPAVEPEPLIERWAVGLRLSNEERDRLLWLTEHLGRVDAAAGRPWSTLQPLLVHPGIADLLDLEDAIRAEDGRDEDSLDWCRRQLTRPREDLDPPPLIHGGDLLALGLPRGPLYRVLLEEARAAQLDGRLTSADEARQFCVERARDLQADGSA